jgi:Domain of unknown function (DUF5011)
MKKYSIIIFMGLALMLSQSCTKKDPAEVSKLVNVTYPGIDLKGNAIVFVQKGGTYTDAGATLTDDISGAKSDVSTTTVVNTSKEGWTEVNYSAANANGFLTSVSRYVLVLNYSPSPDLSGTVDLSGTYKRTSNGILCNVTKLANGLYASDNIAGSSAVFPGYIIATNDSTIDVPTQGYTLKTGPDEIDFANEKLYQTSNPYAFSFVVLNGAFGTSTRKFVKQ